MNDPNVLQTGRSSISGPSILDSHKTLHVTINETSRFTRWVLMKSEPEMAADKKSWRGELCRFLHRREVELTLNGLLIFDLVLLAVGMQIELAYYESQLKAYPKAVAAGAPNLDAFGSHGLHTAEIVLKWMSVSILGIFGLENLLLILGLGLGFFSNPMHPFDLVIVGLSIYFEVAKESFATIVLLLSRMWRIVRLMHGFVEVKDDGKEHDAGGEEKEKPGAAEAESGTGLGASSDLEAARREGDRNPMQPPQEQEEKKEKEKEKEGSSLSSTSVDKPLDSKQMALAAKVHLSGPDEQL